MNKGKISFSYLGDGAGDKNLPDLEYQVNAIIENKDSEDSSLVFEMDYPDFPYNGELVFNLKEGRSENEKIFFLTCNIIVLADADFLIVADLFYITENDTENFEIIGRFQGKVPDGLKFKYCPIIDK